MPLRRDARTFFAVAEHHGYSTGPVSRLTLDGVPPAYVFQRQTNTFSKRHHVRVWPTRWQVAGLAVWLGAATHDIAIEFSRASHSFTHRIDGDVDGERAKVVADLVDAGAVAGFGLMARPSVAGSAVNAARIARSWATARGRISAPGPWPGQPVC